MARLLFALFLALTSSLSLATLKEADAYLLDLVRRTLTVTPHESLDFSFDTSKTPAELQWIKTLKPDQQTDTKLIFHYDQTNDSLQEIEISRSTAHTHTRVTNTIDFKRDPHLLTPWTDLISRFFLNRFYVRVDFQRTPSHASQRATLVSQETERMQRAVFSPEVGSVLFALEQDASTFSNARELKLWELRPTEQISGEIHSGSRLLLSHRGIRIVDWALAGFQKTENGIEPGAFVAVDSSHVLWRAEFDIDGRNGVAQWTRLGSQYQSVEASISTQEVYALNEAGELYAVPREGEIQKIEQPAPIQRLFRDLNEAPALLTRSGHLMSLTGEALSTYEAEAPEAISDLLLTEDAIWIIQKTTQSLIRINRYSGVETHRLSFESLLSNIQDGSVLQILDQQEEKLYLRAGEKLLRITRPTFGRSLSYRIVEPLIFGEDLRKLGVLYQLHNEVSIRQPRLISRTGERIGGIEYRSTSGSTPRTSPPLRESNSSSAGEWDLHHPPPPSGPWSKKVSDIIESVGLPQRPRGAPPKERALPSSGAVMGSKVIKLCGAAFKPAS